MTRAPSSNRIGISIVALVATFSLSGASAAWAESPTWLCVPESAGAAVTSGGSEGKCEAKSTAVELPPPAELTTLSSVLPHMQYVASGVSGKPTIKFSAVNVQIINGEGKTSSVNGEGNLVIGYDENPAKHEQTGSHDLILGEEQTFTSYGDLLAGDDNAVTAPFASITGGHINAASGKYASVSGGGQNTASGEWTSISGGFSNTTKANDAWVGGGEKNTASSIGATVSGGYKNTANRQHASVSGGRENTAEGEYASIFGGKELKATNEYEAIP